MPWGEDLAVPRDENGIVPVHCWVPRMEVPHLPNSALFPMESAAKLACGAPARQLLCCISADFPRDKESRAPPCPSQDRGPQRPQWMISPKQKNKRDTAFAQRKAERAAMRAQLREKYQLPKSRTDKKQMEAAGGKLTFPQDLLAIVKSKATSDAGSLFPSFSDLDFGSFQMTARNAMRSLQHPVQCPVM
ncbi:PREDICTED: complexin-3-like [Gekko japonicus]|uniref:Complexin-3-like n=1 Tax=Gekko japonicus TaxID=146911 RepID=A0ABM1KN37_GEKJA|nr:PREDICTED: complexin-3-like [Gekko japonicus]